MFLADAVSLYVLLVNDSLAENADYRNGTWMFERAQAIIFDGTLVKFRIDTTRFLYLTSMHYT